MERQLVPGAIYARQSLTRDGSESRELQVEVCTEAAVRLGINVVAVLVEPPSTSGYKDRGRNRAKFKELLGLLSTGQIKCVLVYKSERLSRGGGPGWAPVFDALEEGGLDPDRAVATPQGWMNEFEIGIRATMDREESKKAATRTRDNHARAAKTGKPRGGGLRPFGYERDLVTICEPEAELIRDAASRVLHGESALSVARDWNAQGVMTSTGGHWGSQVLKRVLRSERIAGHRAAHGEIVCRDAWPAILDEETWAEVRNRIDNHPNNGRKAAAGGGRARTALLTGWLYCGGCGSRMHSRTRKANGKTRREYLCQSPETSGQAKSCYSCVIHADPVEQCIFEDVVLASVLTPEWRGLVLKSIPRIGDDHGDIAAEMAELDRRRERLNEMYMMDGNMTRSQYDRLAQQVERERNKALATLSARSEVKLLSSLPVDADGFRQAWNERGLEWQRLVVDLCLDAVVIRQGRAARSSDRVVPVVRSWMASSARTDEQGSPVKAQQAVPG